MTQTEAIDFVHEFYFAVWAALDPEKLPQYYSESVRLHSGDISFGYEEVLKHLTNLKATYQHLTVNFHNIIVLDNSIMVWMTQRATDKEGVVLVLETMATYEIGSDGKIVNVWFMWDKPFQTVFRGFNTQPGLSESADSIQNLLSRRELECFFYTIHGKTAKQIAQILEISNRTVEDYIVRVRTKLHLETQQDIIDYALEKGFIQVNNNLTQIIKQV